MRNEVILAILVIPTLLICCASSAVADLYDFRVSATLHHFVHNRPMHLWTRELAEGATSAQRATAPNRRRSAAATRTSNSDHHYLLSPTPDFIVPLEETTAHASTFPAPVHHHHSPSPNLVSEADPLRLRGERIQLEEERWEEIEPAVAQWRLHNQCSAGYVQSFRRMVNAQGRARDKCLVDFLIHPHSRDGSILLEQRCSRRFICLNRRGRVVARKLKRSRSASDIRCRFFEHLTPGGYTLLESVWRPGRYVTADRKGKLTEGRMTEGRVRCHQFGKIATGLDRVLDASPNEASGVEQERLYDVARSLLLSRVEV